MTASGRSGWLGAFLVLFLDFPAHPARNAGTNETVHEVQREERRQDIIENLLAQNQDEAQEQSGDDGFRERAGGAQSE